MALDQKQGTGYIQVPAVEIGILGISSCKPGKILSWQGFVFGDSCKIFKVSWWCPVSIANGCKAWRGKRVKSRPHASCSMSPPRFNRAFTTNPPYCVRLAKKAPLNMSSCLLYNGHVIRLKVQGGSLSLFKKKLDRFYSSKALAGLDQYQRHHMLSGNLEIFWKDKNKYSEQYLPDFYQ